jgi:hypothetical protein
VTVREALDLLTDLDEGDARDQLREYINHTIIERTKAAMAGRRDPMGISIAVSLAVVAVIVSVLALRLGGWWNVLQIFAGFIGIIALVGFVQSVRKVERDEKGNALPSSPRTVPPPDSASESPRS